MKTFNNYTLNKNDNQLIKNFKLDDNYTELIGSEKDNIWLKILNTTNTKKLRELYKNMRNMKCYITTINEVNYLIYSYYEKNFYNLFFYNIDTGNINERLDMNRDKLILFANICNIFITELKNDAYLNYKINIPNKYSKLYFKFIQKIYKESKNTKQFYIKKISKQFYFYSKEKRYGPLPLFYLKEKIYSYKKPFVDNIKIIKSLQGKL